MKRKERSSSVPQKPIDLIDGEPKRKICANTTDALETDKSTTKDHQQILENRIQPELSECDSEPTGLCCPLTLQLFKDPVCSTSGVTYERSAILKHFRSCRSSLKSAFCPVTRIRCHELLITNYFARNEIQKYLDDNKSKIPYGWKSRNVPPPMEIIVKAFKKGSAEKEIQSLLNDNVDYDALCEALHPHTPLIIAFKNGFSNIFKELLKSTSFQDVKVAIQIGEFEVLQELLLYNPDYINSIKYIGINSVHLACMYGRVDMLDFLVKHNGDVQSVSKSGQVPITIATHHGHHDVVARLIDLGVNIDYANVHVDTALIQSIACGYESITKLLILNGADVHKKTSCGLSPLFCALHKKQYIIGNHLLAVGADSKSVPEEWMSDLSYWMKERGKISNLISEIQPLPFWPEFDENVKSYRLGKISDVDLVTYIKHLRGNNPKHRHIFNKLQSIIPDHLKHIMTN